MNILSSSKKFDRNYLKLFMYVCQIKAKSIYFVYNECSRNCRIYSILGGYIKIHKDLESTLFKGNRVGQRCRE